MGVRVPKEETATGPRFPGTGGAGQHFWAALVFASATLVLSYPLGFHPASLSRLDNGDARLNAWAMSWVAHQLTHDPLRLFEANTFYPLPHSLAYSEHLTLQGLLALPLLALTDDLVLTNNLILLFSMFASAFGMYWLALTLTGSHAAAILAGLFFSFAPYRFNRLPHMQVQLYVFLPVLLACLHRFLETRRSKWLVLVASAFVLQALAGTYLGAIAAVALGVALLTLLPFASLSRSELGGIALALAVAALSLLPFALPYLWVHRALGVEWDLPGVGSLSATPASYLASSSHLYRGLTDAWLEPAERTDYLFPGLTLAALGLAGFVLLLCDRSRRRWAYCYGGIVAAGILFSLGPATPVYPFFYEHVVFFRGLRALTRFGLLPLFGLSVLGAVALAWLLERRIPSSRRAWVSIAIGLFFVAESTALPYRLTAFEDRPPEVYRWLAEAKPGPIVELPFKVIDTRYMFWARHHGFRPMLNGDSGFIPISHQWMKSILLRFPSSDAIALLRRLRVRYVILHLGAFRKPALLRLLREIEEHRSTLVPLRDFGRDLVFEVVPAEPKPPPAVEALTPLAASGSVSLLFDGDTATPFRADQPESEIQVALAERATLRALRLHYGAAPRVPIESIEILPGSGPGARGWSTPPEWPALTELVMGLLETPLDGTQTVAVAPITEQSFRLRLRGLDGERFEITEIELLGDRAPVTN